MLFCIFSCLRGCLGLGVSEIGSESCSNSDEFELAIVSF